MSSPRKKLKLTPQKHKNGSQRYTQETKVTSTPHRASELVVSPGVSRISTSGSSARTVLSGRFVEKTDESCSLASSSSSKSRTNSSISQQNSENWVIAEEDYDAYYFKEFGKIKYTGAVWKIYKPLDEDTIYARLLQDPQNIEETVRDFFVLYERKPESAIYNLLKFCIDVCGFQNLDISEHYNFHNESPKKIIMLLENENVLNKQETLMKTGRYLLMEKRTHLTKMFKVAVYSFLQKIIISAHDSNVLYDEFFCKHFFLFIKTMAFSDLRCIRHTGVIFAIKVLTSLVMVFNKIIHNIDNSSENESNLASEENPLLLKKMEVKTFVDFFYIIFIKNCRLQDSKLTLMRVECMHEINVWIRYFPDFFITQLQLVTYLIKLITDPSVDVRLAALETCERFVETPDILTVLKKSNKLDFSEAIRKRFYDVDIKVSVKAIDIFTKFLKCDKSFITTSHYKLLTSLVFDKFFPIGEAAAKFLTYYLQSTEESEEVILLQLAKLSLKKKGDAIVQLLVEGCLENCTAIQNWQLFTDLLLQDIIEENIKQALVKIFAESVQQTLTGKSTETRQLSRKVKNIDSSHHISVAKYFPVFNDLLRKYEEHVEILTEILKIIPLVNDTVLKENYYKHYADICTTLEELLSIHNDENLLNKIVETLYYFFNITNFRKRAETYINDVISGYSKKLVDFLSNWKEEYYDITLKIEVISTHFNITEYFQWETLFDSWNDVDENARIHLVVCCKWFLIWSLRNLTSIDNYSTAELSEQFNRISCTCKEYSNTCFNLLQNLDGQPLHFKAYECLCDFYITVMRDLETPIKFFKPFEQLKLVIDDKQLITLLSSFLDKYIISNKAVLLPEKQVYVVKYIDLVHSNVLPLECLACVFKYYHVYFIEYGPIIDSCLKCMAMSDDENSLLLMVVYTVTTVYEDLINKYNVVDIRTEEAKNIKLLVKQFINFKEFKTPKKSFKKLLYFSIKYAFKDESKYSFLYFTKYFVDLLVDNEDKKELLEYLKKMMPKGAEKNDAVLYLANYLKNFISKKSDKTTKQKKENKNPSKNMKSVKKRDQPKKLNKPEETSKKRQKKVNVDSETETSDDLTIHDSESDDLDENITNLRI